MKYKINAYQDSEFWESLKETNNVEITEGPTYLVDQAGDANAIVTAVASIPPEAWAHIAVLIWQMLQREHKRKTERRAETDIVTNVSISVQGNNVEVVFSNDMSEEQAIERGNKLANLN